MPNRIDPNAPPSIPSSTIPPKDISPVYVWIAGGASAAFVSVGASLLAFPEPTMITKILGVAMMAIGAGLGAMAGAHSRGVNND